MEAPYKAELQAVVDEIQEMTDLGYYLLSDEYIIAQDIFAYYNCSNEVFVDYCYP